MRFWDVLPYIQNCSLMWNNRKQILPGNFRDNHHQINCIISNVTKLFKTRPSALGMLDIVMDQLTGEQLKCEVGTLIYYNCIRGQKRCFLAPKSKTCLLGSKTCLLGLKIGILGPGTDLLWWEERRRNRLREEEKDEAEAEEKEKSAKGSQEKDEAEE